MTVESFFCLFFCLDDVSCCGERIDSCTGSSSDGLCDSEADKSIWRWEVPIDLSVFNCFFMELDIAEVNTIAMNQ